MDNVKVHVRTVENPTLHNISCGVLAAQSLEVRVYIDRYIYIDLDADMQCIDR